MAAGVADKAWEISDIVNLLEQAEAIQEPAKKAEREDRAIQRMSEKGPALGF